MEVVNLAHAVGAAVDSLCPAPASAADVPKLEEIRGNDGLPAAGRGASLTARQAAFARHYVVCGNGAAAARRAGYSVANARFIARDNLKKASVRRRIQALAAAREEQVRDEAGYLVMMLNAALQMALRQGQPNAMIRALSAMARMTGLDRPTVKPAAPAIQAATNDDADDGADEDRWLAHVVDDRVGLIQEAVFAAAGAADPDGASDKTRPPDPDRDEFAPDEFRLDEPMSAWGPTQNQAGRAPIAQAAASQATKHHITPHPAPPGAMLPAGEATDLVAAP